MKKQFVFILAVFIATILGCKKNKTQPDVAPSPVVTASTTRAELSKDSIFLYAQQIYLWNDKLPTYAVFNPRQYNSFPMEIDNYKKELFEITKYSNPFEYKPGATSSKYSYIFDKANQNPTASIKETASVDLEGNGNDLGIRFGFYGNDANYSIYVSAVYQNSPAEKAGISRGNMINKINGVTYGSNFSANINAINTALSGTTITLEGLKSDGSSFTITLLKSIFKSSPIYKTKVLTAGGKKVGYLAYARFSSEANSVSELNNIFVDFATKGVTDLVIDLRYNGGGYVNTAEHLINLIAPSSASGVMFTEHYNTTMQSGAATILSNQPLLDANNKVQFRNGVMLTYANINYSVAGNTELFAKKGPLTNVTNVVFIVSDRTASASELVINSLKPHMSVKLVGATTYGKPVGFFPVTIENKYDVYFSLFETKNSLGQGGYYDGLVPDIAASEVPGGTIMYDFGDPNDNYLKKALELIAPGVKVTSQSRTMTSAQQEFASPSSNVIKTDLSDNEFKGMIETRFKIKN
jgi:C-terminal processing protease CtpA/Prc